VCRLSARWTRAGAKRRRWRTQEAVTQTPSHRFAPCGGRAAEGEAGGPNRSVQPTKPEFTQEYSYGCVDSTLQPGSPYRGWSEDRCEQFVEGEVLEADPPRRLSHTWQTLWDTEAAAEQKA
jgi:hypothetical protein